MNQAVLSKLSDVELELVAGGSEIGAADPDASKPDASKPDASKPADASATKSPWYKDNIITQHPYYSIGLATVAVAGTAWYLDFFTWVSKKFQGEGK